MFFVLLVACTPSTKTPDPADNDALQASTTLAAIDSLMWRQPDSAFALLKQFAESPQADSLDEFNGHYCQLLISELLYKNYAAQSNREELLQAVAYFDSLVREAPHPPLKGGAQRAGDSKKISNLTPNLVFLAARAHYINGAGYYEKDSVVNACAEYLKALEVMEEHFEEKAQTGKKAVFMFYIYNRLLELFSAQFMMEPALSCGEKALAYCRKDTSLSKEIPNTYFHIGKQYDKNGEKDVARSYYEMAIEEISDTNSPIYRDAVSMKALCDYQLGLGAEQSLNTMKQSLASVTDDGEKVVRFLVIGSVYSEEGIYDSALRYFELAFENKSDVTSKIRAAESLRVIYDSLGDREKANEFMRYLADHKKSEGENKALTSRLEGMYKTYMDQKRKEEAEEMREKSIRKTVEIIVPIAILVALAIFVVAKRRSKKLLEDKDRHYQREMEAKETEARKELEEKDKQYAEVLEAERQAHRMEQAAMSGRLKRSNQELRELKDQIKQKDDSVAKTEKAASFNEEPICRLIMDRVNEGQFKSKIDYIVYKDSALDKQQLLDLRLAADRHFGQFTARLKKAYPELTNSDLDYCCLYLLRLTDADVSALMQRAYYTVSERSRKLKGVFGSDEPLSAMLRGFANESTSN